MNETKFSIYSKSTSTFFLGGGEGGGGGWVGWGICPHRTVWIKKSDACKVQPDLDLHCTQKVIMLCLAFKGVIHPKLNDVYQIDGGIMNERK